MFFTFVCSSLAAMFGTYPNFLIDSNTFNLVSNFTASLLLITNETVLFDTLQSFATSQIVTISSLPFNSYGNFFKKARLICLVLTSLVDGSGGRGASCGTSRCQDSPCKSSFLCEVCGGLAQGKR